MADTKISNLTALSTAASTDLFVVVDDDAAETKKITRNNLLRPYILATSSNTTLTTTGGYTHVFVMGPQDISLPSAEVERVVCLARSDSSGTMTTSRVGGDTIQGATSISMTRKFDTATLVSHGSSTWYLF